MPQKHTHPPQAGVISSRKQKLFRTAEKYSTGVRTRLHQGGGDERTVKFCNPDPVLNFKNSIQVKVARRPWAPWICYQNVLCPWLSKKILLSLNISLRPWKFLNIFNLFIFRTIDYVEHSRIKNKPCKSTEQCIDMLHLKQLCSKK